MALAIATAAAALGITLCLYHICSSLFLDPLARIPGPNLFALTSWRLAYEDYRGTRTRTLHALHKRYGPVVRVGPREVSFNSTAAVRTIYGAGSGAERTRFYRMFEAYGRKNMFSFHTGREHSERKKMFARAYAKSAVLKGSTAEMIEDKVLLYLDLVERDGGTSEIFSSLHYFSIDTITQFLYGSFGKTSCLKGVEADRALIRDIIDTARRRLAWFSVHLPSYTEWLYSRTGVTGRVAHLLYPMQTPTTYTGIRRHAMSACKAYSLAAGETREEPTLIAKLWKHHRSQNTGNTLDDADVASECADHLLAGIDTTSDTLMFLIWALSRPENRTIQQTLIDEVLSMPEDSLNADGIPRVEATDKLAYVNAVIKETLRLYPPLPGSEPRSFAGTTTIDGYVISPRTVVSISPYTLHRNPDVFKDPMRFNPDRWLDPSQDTAEMNRWFWAFSSGARMCIGLQYVFPQPSALYIYAYSSSLAMAEMTTLVAAIYRKYTTTTTAGFDVVSPGVTSRYEVFYDDSCSGMRVGLSTSSVFSWKVLRSPSYRNTNAR